MNRRRFLELAGGLATGAMLSCTGAQEAERRRLTSFRTGLSNGPRWAEFPAEHRDLLLPEAARPAGVLELFMLGGVSPWESFYTIPEHGHPDGGGPYAGQQWWTFQNWGAVTVPQLQATCGMASRAPYEPFRTDALGMTVNLGPFVMPLRDRPDILARMRVWVLAHDSQPHEAAIPLAITGSRLGLQRLASFGSHIQRYHLERAPSGRTAPFAYNVIQAQPFGNRIDSVRATGLHPAPARPLDIRLGPSPALADRLARPTFGGHRGAADALIAHYAQRYRERMTSGAGSQGMRAPGLDDFEFVRATLQNHEDLAELITTERLRSSERASCGGDLMRDETTTGLRLAASLLTAPQNAAKYVQVVDGGIYPDPNGMGYDSHPEHVVSQGANIIHGLDALCAVINAPGENDPEKLDLDRHFVLVNTEFGRSPYPEYTKSNPNGLGTNHWPWGYVIVGFGAFADAARSGIVGAIGEDSLAVSAITPAEHRAATLLAMGIWPFEPETFGVADVKGANDRAEAALRLRTHVLGYTT